MQFRSALFEPSSCDTEQPAANVISSADVYLITFFIDPPDTIRDHASYAGISSNSKYPVKYCRLMFSAVGSCVG